MTTYDVFGASKSLGLTLLLLSNLTALLSLILRLHHTRGNERQQIKWFMFAVVPFAVGLSVIILDLIVANFTTDFRLGTVHLLPSWEVFRAFLYVFVFALLLVPAFTYIAILKYRLFDIDVVINRTLVYGLLTAMLVALYVGGILLLQSVFVVLTGEKSTLAVVASTLLIAALFNPLRQRIQSFIDRRFYRRKYDARKTLEAFSSKLRDETDLDALSEDLTSVVRETMQPAHVSLWLRSETAPKGEQAS